MAYSQSWFKKRIAYINKQLAPNRVDISRLPYSPKAEYQKYLALGEKSAFIKEFGGLGDPSRSEKARQKINDELVKPGGWLHRTWGAFANYSALASAILSEVGKPDTYIDGAYRVWVADKEGNLFTTRGGGAPLVPEGTQGIDGTPVKVSGALRLLTVSEAETALESLAQLAKARTANGGGAGGYFDIGGEVYDTGGI